MKLFPDSRNAKLRAALIFAVFVGVCFYRNVFSLWQLVVYEPREGDILFQSLPHGDLVDAIEGVTESPWSHCGILIKENGRWHVVEAISQVRRTALPLWIMRGRSGRFAVYRVDPSIPRPTGGTFHEALSAALSRYIGRPYDFRYAPEDAEIYCSELVFKAYRDAFGLELGAWEELGQLNWQPFESFIRSMEAESLPLRRRMITPVGITRSPLLRQVYPQSSK